MGNTPLDAILSMLVDRGRASWKRPQAVPSTEVISGTLSSQSSRRHTSAKLARHAGSGKCWGQSQPVGGQAPLRHEGRILKSRGKRTKGQAEGGRRREEKNKRPRKQEDGWKRDRLVAGARGLSRQRSRNCRDRGKRNSKMHGVRRGRRLAQPLWANRRAMPSPPAHRFPCQPPARTSPSWLPLQKGTPADRDQEQEKCAGRQGKRRTILT